MIRINEYQLINPDYILRATYDPQRIDTNVQGEQQGPYPSLILALTEGQDDIILENDEATNVWNALCANPAK
jgi:hypothetical protein